MAASNVIAEVREVKSIDDAAEARKVLLELKRHCDPLCQARGWRVERLVEMCCCTRDGKNLGVAGYCQSRGDKRTALKIAVRLRAPRGHALLPFEHALGVLFHELAHIEHGNHSASFYELNDALRKQYELIRDRGFQIVDEAGFPVRGGRALDGARHNPASAADARARGASAACSFSSSQPRAWQLW